ncbi:hypothetical protein Pcac1_g24354 [Phytophthora cactorum]|nr:hypothetical protein Pcac1_g24354 [Phytophthora cactorum]
MARYQVTEGCLGIGDEVRKGGVLGSKGEVRFAEGAVASEAAGEAGKVSKQRISRELAWNLSS